MTQVYLHVGMPKCASSTVQGYFHRFDRRNAKSGFLYPLTGRSDRGYFSHAPIVRMASDELRGLVHKIKIEAAGAEVVFISSEQFANAYWDRPITADFIRELNLAFGARNVRLLFLFRNHYSFVESAFAQFLKGGLYRVDHRDFFGSTPGDVESYCNHFRDTNGFHFFDFAQVITEFRTHCEPGNEVEVFSIERDDLETGDILEELCRRFGLVPPKRKKLNNPRFPVTALLGLAYGIEKYGFQTVHPKRKGVANRYSDAVDGFSPVLHVHGDFAKTIASIQRADSAFFSQEFGMKSSALFLPRLDPPYSEDLQAQARLTDDDRAWLEAHFTGT